VVLTGQRSNQPWPMKPESAINEAPGRLAVPRRYPTAPRD
jgi:hypothetical protein